MAVWDNSITYHVSLRTGVRVKMGGRSLAIYAFDGQPSFDGPAGLDTCWAFRTDCVYISGEGDVVAKTRRAIRIQLLIPFSNLAGMVPQPFENERK